MGARVDDKASSPQGRRRTPVATGRARLGTRVHSGAVTHDDDAATASSASEPAEGGARRSLRDRVRGARRAEIDVAPLDPERAPAEPIALFLEWLDDAVEAGVAQPHAVTLSTASAASGPTARTLLLKEVDDAFWFTTSSLSPKGRQIADDPRVALTLAWSDLGRQVRVLGDAVAGPRDVSEDDFRARHPDSRAVAIAMPQSTEIPGADEADQALADARRRLDEEPDLVPDDWTAYRVAPVSVEFWQGTTGRDQVRLRYDRVGDGWRRASLWP
jgi:pyridoxamine 5'-phosphate oxidase